MSSLSVSQAARESIGNSNFEGILELLNEAPAGIKVFCGKQIYAKFQHVLETKFIHAKVSEDIYESEYCSDDEDRKNNSRLL